MKHGWKTQGKHGTKKVGKERTKMTVFPYLLCHVIILILKHVEFENESINHVPSSTFKKNTVK